MKRTIRALSFILAFSLTLTSVEIPVFADGIYNAQNLESDYASDVSQNMTDVSLNNLSISGNDVSYDDISDNTIDFSKTDDKENENDISQNDSKDISQNDISQNDNSQTEDVSENEGYEIPENGNNDDTAETVLTTDNQEDISANEEVENATVSGNDESVFKYTVSNPKFSIDSSEVKAGQKLTITTDTLGATIYYSLTNEIPEKSEENVYLDSIIIDREMTVTAVAVKDGLNDSGVTREVYTIKDESEDWGDILEEDRTLFNDAYEVPKALWMLGVEDRDYSGKPQTFSNLRVYSHKTKLVYNKDYTVKYSSNVNAGTATVTVTGKGNYSGSLAETFKIKPLFLGDASGNDENVCIPDISLKYNGKKQKGTTTVTYKILDNWVSLKKDTDFSYSYDPLDTYKERGEHIVSIVGKGNYCGTASFTETITSDLRLMSSLKYTKIKDQPATGMAIEPELTIKNGDYILVKDIDYSVDWQNNVNPGTATAIVKGMGDYAGTKIVNFKITAISMSKVSVGNLVSKKFTGEEITQSEYELTYKAGKNSEPVLLVEGEDYVLDSYVNNINAGKKAVIVFRGINRFSGTLKKNFTILQKEIGEEDVSLVSLDVFYQKNGAKPDVTVTSGGILLKNGIDYSLEYKNNKAVNDGSDLKKIPKVIVKGKGNYKGTISRTFTIKGSSLNQTTITATDLVYQRKAGICKSSITIYDSNNAKLKAGTDYDKNISYTYARDTYVEHVVKGYDPITELKEENTPVDLKTDIIPVGAEINASVLGKGNYIGSSKTVTFRVVAFDISKAKVKIADQFFLGTNVEPDKNSITVTVGKNTVLSKKDYEIVGYKNNEAVGKGTVIIKGANNYGGIKNCSFNIIAKSVKYKITYNNNDLFMNDTRPVEVFATGSMKKSDTAAGGKLSANSYSRKGYKFVGWNTKADGSGEGYLDKDKFFLREKENGVITYGTDVVLYAQWETVDYKIKYIIGYEIKNSANNPSTYTIEDEIVFEEPEEGYYYFKGWYKDEKYKTARDGISIGTTGNQNIYAKIDPFKYTIELRANNKTNKKTAMKNCACGKTYTLLENPFSWANHYFTSWNTKADGSGKKYKSGAKVFNLCTEDGATIVLYAQWDSNAEQHIWDVLMAAIGNEYGVAGLIGNLYAESGLRANNLQNSYNSSIGMTDEEYTDAVDSGKYTNFAGDSAGYGLAQWTSSGRKQRLYEYAKARGKSIGDLDMQLGFLIEELMTSFKSVWNTLVNAKSVKEASDSVLVGFERPRDQSDSAKYRRASYGETFYDKYADGASNKPEGYIKVMVKEALNVRSGPGTNYNKVATLGAGTICYITEIKEVSGYANGWGKLSDGMGWICLDYVEFK